MSPILITGAAGFIGFHVARRLVEQGRPVIGVDNLNAYYDPALKEARLAELARLDGFSFRKLDLKDRDGVAALFADSKFARVVHLAAQAGVRHSLEAPHDYIDSNITGFLNILEGCRHAGTAHLLYASSSSVYGANTAMPFSVSQNVDHPLSLYGASKKANELMRIPIPTCSRFRPRGCGSSRSMARGEGRTWRCGSSPTPFSPGGRLNSSMAAR
jgi:UDP-glucuronate 4-epimerase